MIKVKFFGVLRLDLGIVETEAEASTVKELLEVLKNSIDKLKDVNLKDYVIFVNEDNIVKLKMFRTKLNDGDVVSLMSPVSGG